MLKKILLMICIISFIINQACLTSFQNSNSTPPDFNQIGRLQLAYDLCLQATAKKKLLVRDFVGQTLLGDQWQTTLTTYSQTATTDLTINSEDILFAIRKAYCQVHYLARIQERKDVINFIQHGR